MRQDELFGHKLVSVIEAAALLLTTTSASQASNHLDTPTSIANPQANIGDLYAWTSSNGRQLNLSMDIVGRSFSDKLQYVFHIDSGTQLGKTTSTSSIVCRFHTANDIECRLGAADVARGDASHPEGLEGQNHRFRVFAGLRDDPFFNNIKGSNAGYQVAIAALKKGTAMDWANCPKFDTATSAAILDQFRHTNGGPPMNFLGTWTTSAIVISVDLEAVNKGGKLLAVWAATATSDHQVDRAGRPMMKNSLLGLFQSDQASDALKEKYNLMSPTQSVEFTPEIQKGLEIYDGFDGVCGNAAFTHSSDDSFIRYGVSAMLLADDRLWVNSGSNVCTQLFGVELSELGGRKDLSNDCGGRAPSYNAANVYRSLLVNGTVAGFDDGLSHDEHQTSDSQFPFLGPPQPGPAGNP